MCRLHDVLTVAAVSMAFVVVRSAVSNDFCDIFFSVDGRGATADDDANAGPGSSLFSSLGEGGSADSAAAVAADAADDDAATGLDGFALTSGFGGGGGVDDEVAGTFLNGRADTIPAMHIIDHELCIPPFTGTVIAGSSSSLLSAS